MEENYNMPLRFLNSHSQDNKPRNTKSTGHVFQSGNGGRLSILGDYMGFVDRIPFGSVMNRAITIRTGQVPVQKFMYQLLDLILNGNIDPSFVATHTLPLAETPRGYELMENKEDGCVKVVLKP